jgi:hypothetical protein
VWFVMVGGFVLCCFLLHIFLPLPFLAFLGDHSSGTAFTLLHRANHGVCRLICAVSSAAGYVTIYYIFKLFFKTTTTTGRDRFSKKSVLCTVFWSIGVFSVSCGRVVYTEC